LIGGAGNDTLDGGAGNDSMLGGAGNDYFYGSEGADYMDAGDGFDVLDYSRSNAGVYVKLNSTFEVSILHGGYAEGDTIVGVNFEHLIGSDYDDTLIGQNDAEILEGGAGNDYLDGGANSDSLYGGAGNDTFSGGPDFGGHEVDNDYIDGGDDVDLVDYFGSREAVNVDLSTGIGLGGSAQGDTLISIENLFGSNYNDTLIGDEERCSPIFGQGIAVTKLEIFRQAAFCRLSR
jgi:hypothetical protein